LDQAVARLAIDHKEGRMIAQPIERRDDTSCGGRLVAADGRVLPLRAAELRADAKAGLARVVLRHTFVNVHAEPRCICPRLPSRRSPNTSPIYAGKSWQTPISSAAASDWHPRRNTCPARNPRSKRPWRTTTVPLSTTGSTDRPVTMPAPARG
jgi:hypothetical protein